jgi:hypothetical protein
VTQFNPHREPTLDLTRQLKHIRAEIKTVPSAKPLADDIRKHARWATHAEAHVR